jgi:hypothetical protein
VTAKRARNGAVAFKSARPMALGADAELNSDVQRLFTQQSACPDGGSYGGDGPLQDFVSKEHCSSEGLIEWRMGWSRSRRGAISVNGLPSWPAPQGAYPSLPAACEYGQQGYAETGLPNDAGEHNGGLIEAFAKLPAKKLLGAKAAKVVKLSGSRTIEYPNAAYPEQPRERTTGKTILTYAITFKRLTR